MWTRRLADLFDERTRASFRRSVSHTVWQHGWWVDAARRRVVVVGANQEPRILGLDDGEPLTFDVEDVLGRLDRGAESERTLVLDLVVRHEAAWAQKILAHVGERELAPAARLRIQIAMAKAGDEEARREILARRRSEPDPALRMDILRYLPDAIGPTAAMGILIEELGSTESWAGARDGLVALGAEAIPELTRLLADRSDPTRRHGAVAILRDIGPPAASAVPMLRDVAAEGGPLSETVAMALSRIDTPAALEAMVTVLGAGSREARRHAAAYFQGRPASAAIPGLVALLEVEGDESWQNVIRDGLVRASGEDFGLDAPAWRRWWAERDAR